MDSVWIRDMILIMTHHNKAIGILTYWRICCASIIFAAFTSGPVWGIDEFKELKRLPKLPQTTIEIESAFIGSRSDACEILPKGEALEIQSFANILTVRDRNEERKRQLILTSRRNLFSVGLQFQEQDRMGLPAISRGTITSYLKDHYVGIQSRIRRDLLDRKLYFHHRPIAWTATYRGSKLTKDFEPLLTAHIRDFHSLGLFVNKDAAVDQPESFRTLVLLFRTHYLQPRTPLPKEVYEFVFVRGRESADGLELLPHVFVTTEQRSRLNYLNTGRAPLSQAACSILGDVAVLDFDSTGLYPKRSAIRSYRLDNRHEYALAELEEYCQNLHLEGGFHENLDVVLDDIIDGKLNAL